MHGWFRDIFRSRRKRLFVAGALFLYIGAAFVLGPFIEIDIVASVASLFAPGAGLFFGASILLDEVLALTPAHGYLLKLGLVECRAWCAPTVPVGVIVHLPVFTGFIYLVLTAINWLWSWVERRRE